MTDLPPLPQECHFCRTGLLQEVEYRTPGTQMGLEEHEILPYEPSEVLHKHVHIIQRFCPDCGLAYRTI